MAKAGGLDLDSGLFHEIAPERLSQGPEWSQQAGMDLIALKPDGTNAAEVSGLIFVDARPKEVPDSFWQESAVDLLANPAFELMLKETAAQVSSRESKVWWRETRSPRGSQDTPTYCYKTREGAMGLLQITGSTENPRGVKIRYKLVQNEGGNK
ncbi:MAG: hypothetical protein MUF86_15670, partial [Akkermansiaceae bacterium]|nr:hypothetical protein [Akkermansiaceae bacterium]